MPSMATGDTIIREQTNLRIYDIHDIIDIQGGQQGTKDSALWVHQIEEMPIYTSHHRQLHFARKHLAK